MHGFDIMVLLAFLILKAKTDLIIINVALFGMFLIFMGEYFFLKQYKK